MQAVATVVLSRTLESADYGIVSLALIFTRFLATFNDLGIESAVVQKQDLDDAGLLTAFWLKASLAVALFVIAVSAAPVGGRVFDNQAAIGVIRVLSLSFLIAIPAFVPTTLLTRALDYRRLATAQTWSTVANAVVAVGLALSGYGYWSLVLGQLAATAALVGVLNAMRPRRLAYRFSAARARELVRYGGALFASTLATFVVFNADNFLIGLVLGASALGYYTLALSWGSMVPVLMWSVVNAVLFPTFSTMQANRLRIKSAYLRALHYVSVLGVLLNTVLFFVAPEFLVQVLGAGTDKWLPALTAFRVLCVYGIIRVVLEPLGSVIMALGKTGVLLRATVVAAVIELALLYPALLAWGAAGAACVVTLAYLTQYAIYYPFIRRELDIDWRDVLGAVRPAVLPLLAAVPAFSAYDLLGAENTPLTLVARAASGALCYVATYVLLTRRTILQDIRLALGRP